MEIIIDVPKEKIECGNMSLFLVRLINGLGITSRGQTGMIYIPDEIFVLTRFHLTLKCKIHACIFINKKKQQINKKKKNTCI
jgi:hypothetical protein